MGVDLRGVDFVGVDFVGVDLVGMDPKIIKDFTNNYIR